MKFLKTLIFLFSAALLSFAAGSCSESGLTNTETEDVVKNDNAPASLKVVLTDAPGDFQSVFIDIQEIRIHRSDSAEMDTTQSDTTGNDDEGL